MSKVVHLSRAAHERAKHHCLERGQPMSDWVAGLIAQAIAAEGSGFRAPPPAEGTLPAAAPSASGAEPALAAETFAEAKAMSARVKEPQPRRVAIKKLPPRALQASSPPRPAAGQGDDDEESYQVFAAPPFWDRAAERDSRGSEMAHR